jgi:hypothetical protein
VITEINLIEQRGKGGTVGDFDDEVIVSEVERAGPGVRGAGKGQVLKFRGAAGGAVGPDLERPVDREGVELEAVRDEAGNAGIAGGDDKRAVAGKVRRARSSLTYPRSLLPFLIWL